MSFVKVLLELLAALSEKISSVSTCPLTNSISALSSSMMMTVNGRVAYLGN